jgi:hypothetical protein
MSISQAQEFMKRPRTFAANAQDIAGKMNVYGGSLVTDFTRVGAVFNRVPEVIKQADETIAASMKIVAFAGSAGDHDIIELGLNYKYPTAGVEAAEQAKDHKASAAMDLEERTRY